MHVDDLKLHFSAPNHGYEVAVTGATLPTPFKKTKHTVSVDVKKSMRGPCCTLLYLS